MLFRVVAAIGLIAHAIDSIGNWVISPLGLKFRVPFALLLSLPLLVSATTTAVSGVQQLASRAEPQTLDIEELARPDREPQAYVTVSGLVHEESMVDEVDLLDQDGFVIGLRVDHYYLLRDGADAGVAVVVRSRLDDGEFRRRQLTATVVEDPGWIAAALDDIGASVGRWQVEPDRYLDEPPAGAEGGGVAGSELRPPTLAVEEEAGAVVGVVGTLVDPARLGSCDGDGCTYLLADEATDRAVLLRSPHPPDAIPVEVTGLYLAATLDSRRALDGDWLADERTELRIPERRVLYDGGEPPFRPPTFVGSVVNGATGLLLVGSTVIGYPIFRRDRRRGGAAAGLARTANGEEALDGTFVTVSGRLPSRHDRPRLTDETARLRRFEPMEYELTRWRYGDAPPGVTAKQLAAQAGAAAGDARLVLDLGNHSVLLPLSPSDGAWQEVRPGRLEWLRRGRPALRLRGPDRLDLVLSFADPADRDRLARALGVAAGTH